MLKKGYVWDGPSYPDWAERIIGRREKEALLLASALHDAFGPSYKLLIFGEDAEHIISGFGSIMSNEEVQSFLIEQWGVDGLKVPISIIHGATIYRHVKADHPDPEQTIGWRKRWKQNLGLLMFQRVGRLFSGTADWVDIGDK